MRLTWSNDKVPPGGTGCHSVGGQEIIAGIISEAGEVDKRSRKMEERDGQDDKLRVLAGKSAGRMMSILAWEAARHIPRLRTAPILEQPLAVLAFFDLFLGFSASSSVMSSGRSMVRPVAVKGFSCTSARVA